MNSLHWPHVALDGGGVPGYDAPDRTPSFLDLTGGIVCAVAMAPGRRMRGATQITLMAVGTGAEGRDSSRMSLALTPLPIQTASNGVEVTEVRSGTLAEKAAFRPAT